MGNLDWVVDPFPLVRLYVQMVRILLWLVRMSTCPCGREESLKSPRRHRCSPNCMGTPTEAAGNFSVPTGLPYNANDTCLLYSPILERCDPAPGIPCIKLQLVVPSSCNGARCSLQKAPSSFQVVLTSLFPLKGWL